MALQAVDASTPVKFVFGKVTKIEPLEIYIESKFTIKEADGQIKLTRQVTDYETEITPIDWKTEFKSQGGTTSEAFANHNHDIKGRKKVKIHNALRLDDMVILLRMQGGQTFLVIDKIGESSAGGSSGSGGSGGGSSSGGNATTYEVYEGSYVVTSSCSDQILPTENKLMEEDLTIEGIPCETEENDGGGTTYIIG